MTKPENEKAIAEIFRATVRDQVARGNHASWGNHESVAVIEAICDAAYGSDEGFDAIRDLVSDVVNPSAFAQQLEKLPDGSGIAADGKTPDVDAAGKPVAAHPAYLRRPARGGSGGKIGSRV